MNEIYIGGAFAEPQVVLALFMDTPEFNRYVTIPVEFGGGYRVLFPDGKYTWMAKEFFEKLYRRMTDVEQRFVLFGGDKWPTGKAPFEINTIRKKEAGTVTATTPFCGNCGKNMDLCPLRGGCGCPRKYKEYEAEGG